MQGIQCTVVFHTHTHMHTHAHAHTHTHAHTHAHSHKQDGRILSWGQNTHSQLAHSLSSKSVVQPTVIMKLEGLPVTLIAAGGAQGFALSVSGAVYGWGKNE